MTRPTVEPTGALLFVPAFGEEMNKSRRMVALAAQRFAEDGWIVLQLDHYGCGDSAGDFGDACWQDWLDDVTLGMDWIAAEYALPVTLWAMRAGALVACDWLARSNAEASLLFWQPVMNGKQFLTQFLRLKVAGEMVGDSEAKAVMASVRAELDDGRSVEIAGYRLSAALAEGLAMSSLRLPESYGGRVRLIEVLPADRSSPSPALSGFSDRCAQTGVDARILVAHGPGFWQTQEIELVPELIDRSVMALAELRS